MLKKDKILEKKAKTQKKAPSVSRDGIYYDENSKTWGFRAVRDGKDVRKRGYVTKTEAKEARINFLAEYQTAKTKRPDTDTEVTLKEVYEHYMKYGSLEKRAGTLRKQQSLWENHIGPTFGNRTMVSIGVGELKNYLIELYHKGSRYNKFESGYAYSYVEGFLKLFYLLWGYARRMYWISRDTYRTMCEDKKMRLEMPKKVDEDTYEHHIETYSQEEIQRMAERLKSTNLYTAFLMGYYLGVRISECFSTRWSDIDWDAHTIRIGCQLLMESPHRVLTQCKTVAGRRTIDIPDPLYDHLKELKKQQDANKKHYGKSYRATEIVKVHMKTNQDVNLKGGDFINRKTNGELLTSDSMKSWAVKIKRELGIPFKYHNLRHTHASILAACNAPIPKLKERLGHTKIETTMKYYIGENEIANDKMKESLKSL